MKPPVEEEFEYPELHEWMGESNQENHPYLIYFWLIACTLTLVYILWFLPRTWRAPAVVVQTGRMIPRAEARKKTISCVSPTHIEVLLWVYLIVTVILTTPYVITFIQKLRAKYRREKALRLDQYLHIWSNGPPKLEIMEEKCKTALLDHTPMTQLARL